MKPGKIYPWVLNFNDMTSDHIMQHIFVGQGKSTWQMSGEITSPSTATHSSEAWYHYTVYRINVPWLPWPWPSSHPHPSPPLIERLLALLAGDHCQQLHGSARNIMPLSEIHACTCIHLIFLIEQLICESHTPLSVIGYVKNSGHWSSLKNTAQNPGIFLWLPYQRNMSAYTILSETTSI